MRARASIRWLHLECIQPHRRPTSDSRRSHNRGRRIDNGTRVAEDDEGDLIRTCIHISMSSEASQNEVKEKIVKDIFLKSRVLRVHPFPSSLSSMGRSIEDLWYASAEMIFQFFTEAHALHYSEIFSWGEIFLIYFLVGDVNF